MYITCAYTFNLHAYNCSNGLVGLLVKISQDLFYYMPRIEITCTSQAPSVSKLLLRMFYSSKKKQLYKDIRSTS